MMKNLAKGLQWSLCLLGVVSSQAWAEAPAVAEPPAFAPMIPLVLMFAILYFLVLRPQNKKQKLQQAFIEGLKKGDRIITNSGILGVVKSLSDKIVTLEIDEGVCIKLLRNQVLESATALKETKTS